ncbi:hypothetical protein KP509_35G032200 [Ceratopteris richardii]|nr:hypothetical protein KP509_35G032200 [Ceratopteris richardii]
MWPDLISKAKEGGLDVVDTYVFWDQHEPVKGKYNFQGRQDLVRFVKEVQKAGLFMNLRIGPYISAEWNFGGLPVWLHLEPHVVFRTDNVPFKAQMETFVRKVVNMMKNESLFAWQGGPIIIAQIENEFGSWPLGTPEHAYAMWAAQMAVSTKTGVPWIMCLQFDAPDPIINTFNSYYADDFTPNGADKPKMWTENWTGWFQSYGKPTPFRPAEDISFAVLRFFQKNGSFQNYYMYHGGTNFGRTSGGPFITTSYDYDAPIDEYGLIRQPKWGHLKDMHQAIKLCEQAMARGGTTLHQWLGPDVEVYAYSNATEKCAAFISNSNSADAAATFNGVSYKLPGWSISVLPDCRNVAFNSAKISAQTSMMLMMPVQDFDVLEWEWYTEKIGIWSENVLKDTRFLEQISTAKDSTDYLWYITNLQVSQRESFLANGKDPVLKIDSMRDAVHIFINDELTVSAQGVWGSPSIEVVQPIKLHEGTNTISILSMTVGLQTGATGYDLTGTGIEGSVYVEGFDNGTLDISSQLWEHQVGIRGEKLHIYERGGSENVNWSSDATVLANKPLTWYKTFFDAPQGDDPVALDLGSMGKGQAWVNGQSIGRFWPAYNVTSDACANGCDYRGAFNSSKCVSNCGQPSQRWYHVPRSWLKPKDNLLVLFEEIGGDPLKTSVVVRVVEKVCGNVAEDYPPPLEKWSSALANVSFPEMSIECGKGQTISSINFASFGTPTGQCGSFARGLCHAPSSRLIMERRCLGLRKCTIVVATVMFGEDPCPDQEVKRLAVEAQCS